MSTQSARIGLHTKQCVSSARSTRGGQGRGQRKEGRLHTSHAQMMATISCTRHVPGIQTQQFLAPRLAAATRPAPEGQEASKPKNGPWTPPGVRTHQFFAARPAAATRPTPERLEASRLHIDPRIPPGVHSHPFVRAAPSHGDEGGPRRPERLEAQSQTPSHRFFALRPAAVTRTAPRG